MSNTEHHLEEAEHAQHAKHNPFDRRVAMSMAIIAATLAAVTLASHRSHNERVSELIEASNVWARQNTKRSRYHQYQMGSEMVGVLSAASADEKARTEGKALASQWQAKAAQEKDDAAKEEKTAREHVANVHHAHQQSNFFDSGELCLELGLVLCSVAMLSKQRWFWFSGIGVSVLGAAAAFYGLTLGLSAGHGEASPHASPPAKSAPAVYGAASGRQQRS